MSRTLPNDTKADLSLDKLQIQNLVEARDEATRRHEEMSAAFARIEAHLGSNANTQPPLPPLAPPTYSASTYVAVASSVTPTQVSDSMEASAGHSRDLQSTGTFNTSVNARVSDCLDLCTSTVLRLANTIDEATHRWHSVQILEHQTVTESLKAAIEAVAYLSDEGNACSSPASTVLLGKATSPQHGAQGMAHDRGEQSIKYGQQELFERRLPSTLDFEQQMQTPWSVPGTRHTFSSSTYIPPPPPPPSAPPFRGMQLPPPPPRMSSTILPSRGRVIYPPPGQPANYGIHNRHPLEQSYPNPNGSRAYDPTAYIEYVQPPSQPSDNESLTSATFLPASPQDQVLPLEHDSPMNEPSVPEPTSMLRKVNSLADRRGPSLQFSDGHPRPRSRSRSPFIASKGGQIFKIPDELENSEGEGADDLEAATMQEDSDDSDDGLFAIPIRSSQQQASSGRTPSFAKAQQILGITDDSNIRSPNRPELKLGYFGTFKSNVRFESPLENRKP